MRRYETIFIVDNDLTEDGRNQRFDKVKSMLAEYGGTTVNFDEWGLKKLAYEINKKNRGYYVYFDYCSEPDFVTEMERSFRLDDKVLKFMTILLDNDTTPEAVIAEAEKAEAEKKAEAEAKATEVEAKATEAVAKAADAEAKATEEDAKVTDEEQKKVEIQEEKAEEGEE